ncbi:MAG: lasso peptide biosynthesis B2 protein [Caldilinea sp. CFX5]|nr:lasso peptide biosynthesis B2 protein [Caldilinea sp. CFX5]
MQHLRRLQQKLKCTVAALRQVDWRRDGWLFLRMATVAALTPLLMRGRLAQVSRWLTVTPTTLPPEPWSQEAEIARRLHCMAVLMAVGRPLIQPRCLTRGVTLYTFFRRINLPVELHFGVQQRNAAFTGHCWLVLAGHPFAEPGDPTAIYTTVYRLPQGRIVHEYA